MTPSRMSDLELEFRQTVFSNETVYEIINRQWGKNISHLYELARTGERACVMDKASTRILEAMQEIYR